MPMLAAAARLAAVFCVASFGWSAAGAAQLAGAVTVQQVADIPPNAGSFAELGASCPAGLSALSGGIDTNLAGDDLEVTTLGPTFAGTTLFEQPDGPRTAADGWHARVINYGSSSRRVALTIVCAQVQNVVVSIASRPIDAATPAAPGNAIPLVSCLDGTVATGGGVAVSGPASMKLTGTAPLFDAVTMLPTFTSGSHAAPTGWQGAVANQGAEGGVVKIAAICAPLDAVTTEIAPAITLRFATHGSYPVSCPAGTIAVGGGIASANTTRLIVTASTPTYAGGVLPTVRATGIYSPPTGWLADMFSHAENGDYAFVVAVVCFRVADTPPGGAATIYEFYNTNLKHYFRTSSGDEADAIDHGSAGPGWQRTGDNYVAFAPGFGDIGSDVCRFYTFGANSHFYTAFAEECASLKAPSSGWTYEGLSYRIQLPVAGACPDGTVPIHRLYNNRFMFNDSNHRFTSDFANVAPLVALGWIYEGIAFCALGYSAGG